MTHTHVATHFPFLVDSGNFELLNGDFPVKFLTVTIHNPKTNKKEFESIGESRNEFHIESNDTNDRVGTNYSYRYDLCFFNMSFKPMEIVQIGFNIHIVPMYQEHADTIGPQSLQVSHVQSLSEALNDRLDVLLDHVEYRKVREKIHREVVESTFVNTWKWTLVGKLVLVGVSLAQIFYIKLFFGKERRY
jgi:hypothetical protein